MKVVGAPREHFDWILSRIGTQASKDFKAIEAIDDSGRIHGMVGFDGWTANSVVMTVAVDNPASVRSLIVPTFDYIFNQAKRGVALSMVRDSNRRSISLCTKIGLRPVCRIRDGVAIGEDIVIFEMRREDCGWIGKAA